MFKSYVFKTVQFKTSPPLALEGDWKKNQVQTTEQRKKDTNILKKRTLFKDTFSSFRMWKMTKKKKKRVRKAYQRTSTLIASDENARGKNKKNRMTFL